MSAVLDLAQKAKQASRRLARLSAQEKNDLLLAMADQLELKKKEIRAANEEDLAAARKAGISGSLLDRLDQIGRAHV